MSDAFGIPFPEDIAFHSPHSSTLRIRGTDGGKVSETEVCVKKVISDERCGRRKGKATAPDAPTETETH